MPKITREEVGELTAIHLALWNMIRNASSPELAARLERVWNELPASQPDGLCVA